METKSLDIVYFVKESVSNEELRYSLRSVEKNLPHRKIWIYGGCPSGIKPDYHVHIRQSGNLKYDRVQNMFREVCLNDRISKNFILMNDDFFVMQKTKRIEPVYRCTLKEHVALVKGKFGANAYSFNLLGAMEVLEKYGFTQLSYELHVPMVINRHKMLEVLGAFPGVHAIRSLYGNYNNIGGEQTDDVKVYEIAQMFDSNSQFLSTEDVTFQKGPVGEFIRNKFKDPSGIIEI